MDRPKQFEEHQWVGDKRTQIVYDIDALDGENDDHVTRVAELMDSEMYLCFGPDTLLEARNRGFRPFLAPG